MKTIIVTLVLSTLGVAFGGIVTHTSCAHGGGFNQIRIDGESGDEAHYDAGGSYLHACDFTAKLASTEVVLTVSASFEGTTIVLLSAATSAGSWVPGQSYTLSFPLSTPNPIFESRNVPFQVDLTHRTGALEACGEYIAHIH